MFDINKMLRSCSPLLEDLVENILNTDQKDFSKTILILPTKRAVLFAREYFIKHAKRAIVMPEIVSFDTLVYQYSKYRAADQEDLLTELHSIFKQDKDTYKLAFNDFLNYAFLLIKDFDQIDHNMVNDLDFFNSLSEKNSLDRWAEELNNDEFLSFDENGMLADYFDFWKLCKGLKPKYTNSLLKKNLAYSGLAYRQFAENFDELTEQINYNKVVFAGFNYLTKSQLQILTKFKERFDCSLIWDIDEYFMNSSHHDSARYLRNYTGLKVEGSAKKYLKTDNFPDIEINSCPNRNSQVKKGIDDILHLLSKLDYESQIKGKNNLIALIPADENLLNIILESFPASFKDKNGTEYSLDKEINISMGRKLSESQFYLLLKDLFELQVYLNKELKIPYELLMNILVHPLIVSGFKNRSVIDNYDNEIRKANKAILSLEDIFELKNENDFIELIFKNWSDKKLGFTAYAIQIVDKLIENKDLIPQDEIIFLSRLKLTLIKLEGIFKDFEAVLEHKEFQGLCFNFLNKQSIPFSGQPLCPIQVIGLLETRALDFENVFLLSCNEGELPSRKSNDSLIPFDIKLNFGLPTFIDKDASLSYTFYRLFYRSNSLNFYYHNSKESLSGKSKPSRFLKQMELELLPDFKKNVNIKAISHYFPKIQSNSLIIEKDDKIIEQIKLYLSGRDGNGNKTKGLSPSMLNTYLRSPVLFFQRAILKIQEQESLERNFEAKTFGSILHNCLEEVFKPFQGELINKDTLKLIKSKTDLNSLITSETKKIASNIEVKKGLNKLYIYSAELLLKRYFSLLQNSKSFKIIGVEKTLYSGFSYKHDLLNADIELSVYGKADRLDQIDNQVRIVDYKSGSFNNSSIAYKGQELLWEDEKRDKIIQLLLYKYFLINADKDLSEVNIDLGSEINSGFYFFRMGNQDFIPLKIESELSDNLIFKNEIESLLKKVTHHMLDPNIPFTEEIEENIFI